MYPALSVLQALEGKFESVLWVGGQGGMEADLVERAGVPFRAIPAAGVHGVGLRALPGNLWKLIQGVLAAGRVLREFRPDVLLMTGGYVAAPMAVAAWRIPTVLYVPDIEPGMALKFLARFADHIALTAEPSRAFFPQRKAMTVTGYPTRPELDEWDRRGGQRRFAFKADVPVLLVAGGSKGARSLNRAVLAHLPELLRLCQVVHVSGQLDWEEVDRAAQALPEELAFRYRAFPYLHDMGAALASADLAVMRAGASTLGELPKFGLPAVLVPYPYAWRYQKVNAAFLEAQGAAVMVRDEELGAQLLGQVSGLLQDPSRLDAMRAAMRSLAQPGAAERIAALVLAQAKGEDAKAGGPA